MSIERRTSNEEANKKQIILRLTEKVGVYSKKRSFE
jgi:hypothetical protein